MLPSIEDVRESVREFAASKDLFSPWYFGREAVDELLAKVNDARQAREQERTFIGKTRLLLEASKRTPLILIRLDNGNVVYQRLLDYVEQEKTKISSTTSFRQWRTHNRRVMLYLRAFFLSYMLYARDYKKAHEKRLFDADRLVEVEDEINLFNASLLNGGQFLVRALFDSVVEQLQNDLTEAHDDDLHDKVHTAIRNQHDALSIELDRPTLAIDECHMPLYEASGLLFHSDYEAWEPEDVLEWQRYEFFRDKSSKGALRGYPDPYTRGGPTTLFSGFRWVLEGYLRRPGEVHQTSIFTSTRFSVWEPLMDKSRFSQRERPAIARVYLQKMLSCKDLLEVIQTIENRSIDGDERKEVSSQLGVWCGRPGFFCNRFLRCFQEKSRNTPLLARIKQAHKEAELQIVENVFNRALESLRSKKSIKFDAASVSDTDDEIINFLCDCHRLRGGNVHCLSSTMAKLVSAGFAIVKEYEPGANGKSVGVVVEPLVRNFLDSLMANDSSAYAQCDMYVAHEIQRASERVGDPQREKQASGTANDNWVIPHACRQRTVPAAMTATKKRRNKKER